jgi:squalene synthase HpnC
MAALVPVVDAHGLTPAPFRALIQANRVDQVTTRYQDFEALMGYCELSANPVGLLVLQLAGLATPERVRRSDAICSALQIVEHLQDVAEDRARDRIYLPAEDLARYGVDETDLDAPHAGPALRALIAHEAQRARELLDQGAPLVGSVGGRLRLLLAGFAAGGYAVLDALAAADHDVLAGAPKPRKSRLLREVAATLVRGR